MISLLLLFLLLLLLYHCGEKEKMLVTSIYPFPTMFSTFHKTNFKFSVTFILSSANAFDLDKPKILSFGKEIIKTLYYCSFV